MLEARELVRDDIRRRFSYCTPTERARWATTCEKEFERLWSTGGLFGVVLDGPIGKAEGFALAGFLQPDFSQAIQTSRTPYATAMADEWLQRGQSPLLPCLDKHPEVFAKIAGAYGTHLHLFEFHWEGGLECPATIAHRAYLSKALNERYVGCHLRLLTIEVHPNALDVVLRGGFSIVNDYPEASADDRVKLCGADRNAANLSSQFWLLQAFAPPLPSLPLAPRLRRILFHFRAGLSDQEIANRVFLSPRSMKNYWTRIFEAFHNAIDGFVDEPQKRRVIYEYLKTHPEEVWPYQKPSKRRT